MASNTEDHPLDGKTNGFFPSDPESAPACGIYTRYNCRSMGTSPTGNQHPALHHHAEWSGLLSNAGPRDHIVQLYQDQQFLNRAVCRFAASAITNGEGVILVPTVAHWDAFRPRLESE